MTLKVMQNHQNSRYKNPPKPTIMRGVPSWRMYYDNNAMIADASRLEDLISVLIPDYLSLSEHDQYLARSIYMRELHKNLKTSIYAHLTLEEMRVLNDEERAILASEKDLDFSSEDAPYIWNTDVPLVLMENNYIPYKNAIPPLSKYGDRKNVPNILWLRITEEQDFLQTLHYAGVITFLQTA